MPKELYVRTLVLSIGALSLLVLLIFTFEHLKASFADRSYSSSAAVFPAVILSLTNADRIANVVPTLTENSLLDQAAQMKADDMVAQNYYAHVNPQGEQMFYWVDKVGYKYLNLGENLDLTYLSTDEDVNSAWMNSPEHRDNILRSQFTETGVGVATGVYEGHDVTFAVQLFATPLPSGTKAPVPHVATTIVRSVLKPIVPQMKSILSKLTGAPSAKMRAPVSVILPAIILPTSSAATSSHSEDFNSSMKVFVNSLAKVTEDLFLQLYPQKR